MNGWWYCQILLDAGYHFVLSPVLGQFAVLTLQSLRQIGFNKGGMGHVQVA